MTIDIEIRGLPGVEELLERFEPRPLEKRLQKAAKTGGNVVAKAVRGEAPIGPTRNLRKSVRAIIAKRDKPGAVVVPGRRKAPHRHLVIRGTKRGQKPNPFVSRGAAKSEQAALDVMERDLQDLFE